MHKILNTQQLKKLDQVTIEKQNITSFQLMERAAHAIVDQLNSIDSPEANSHFAVFCGMGNNGGDGLAVARLLKLSGKKVDVFILAHKDKASPDFKRNLAILQKLPVSINVLDQSSFDFSINPHTIIVDSIFGIGLSRPIDGFILEIIKRISGLSNKVVAIDLPTGFPSEDNFIPHHENCIKADHTITIGMPKLSLFLPSSNAYVGSWLLAPIGLDEEFIESIESNYYQLQKSDIKKLIKKREAFSHKGSYGHALIIAGSYGKIGAAVLSAKACLKSGAGLVTVYTPKCGYEILQSSIAEAMVITSKSKKTLSSLDQSLDFSSVGLGPGIGTSKKTTEMLLQIIESSAKPMVFDADALNILSSNRDWFKKLPSGSVLTPHPGEFKRMVGVWNNDYERLELLVNFSRKYKVYVILKGKFSSLACPTGEVFFNSTGNSGMATAGSGDVLTGIITSLLAQSYHPKEAALIAMYLHGLAGDLAASGKSGYSMVASDIIDHISAAYLSLLDGFS